MKRNLSTLSLLTILSISTSTFAGHWQVGRGSDRLDHTGHVVREARWHHDEAANVSEISSSTDWALKTLSQGNLNRVQADQVLTKLSEDICMRVYWKQLHLKRINKEQRAKYCSQVASNFFDRYEKADYQVIVHSYSNIRSQVIHLLRLDGLLK